jgi:hypothetical protein
LLIFLCDDRRHLSYIEPLGNMLTAVSVPCRHCEEDRLLRSCIVSLREKSCDEIGIAFDNLRVAPDLHTLLVPIIYQKEVGLWIVRQIPEGDVLPITDEVGETDGSVVQNPKKPWRTSTVLVCTENLIRID